MGDPTKRMECSRHGEGYATFVCKHLVDGTGIGFVFGDTQDPRPDAWCNQCDEVLLREGGEWDEVSEGFAQVTALCSGCYDEIRARNQRKYS